MCVGCGDGQEIGPCMDVEKENQGVVQEQWWVRGEGGGGGPLGSEACLTTPHFQNSM